MSVKDALGRLAELSSGPGPLLVVLVGPNGAGKSTFYQRYLKRVSLPFVNADRLAETLVQSGAPSGEETERLAAGLADKKRADFIARRASFITETVFSDPVGAKVQSLRDAQVAGYTVVLIFICVESAELSALRVETRVAAGGHDVPREKIAARYERMRTNVKAALTFVDFAVVVDNSSLERPLRPVASLFKGQVVFFDKPMPWWAADVLPEI